MIVAAGERLRAAREQKGFSIEDVAARLKVPARYVAAIEQGDLAALPEPTFVRGYVKAYANTVGIDAMEMLASLAPIEVKAPKPLVNMDKGGSVTPSRRGGGRAPKFRGGLRRHHWVAAGVLAVIVAGWAAWLGHEDSTDRDVTPVAVTAAPAAPAPPTVGTVPSADGMVTVEVALPGAVPAPAPGLPVDGAPVAPATPAASLPATPAAAPQPAATPGAAPASVPVPSVAAPRKGLYLKFHGTSWVEVRDAANVVIHTSIALQDSELALDGRTPLTLTLGEAGAADVWYNGERVSLDRFPRGGVARIIIGQGAR